MRFYSSCTHILQFLYAHFIVPVRTFYSSCMHILQFLYARFIVPVCTFYGSCTHVLQFLNAHFFPRKNLRFRYLNLVTQGKAFSCQSSHFSYILQHDDVFDQIKYLNVSVTINLLRLSMTECNSSGDTTVKIWGCVPQRHTVLSKGLFLSLA